ncbi:MAG: DUF5106 domain-containing protein [Bacteroidales bacterium]|nr:DUF5106 domain-containing protein [Bacteroidales bacterium]MBR1850697.1 DUF5106 domain-containing protein [Bacteroidales bacterium]
MRLKLLTLCLLMTCQCAMAAKGGYKVVLQIDDNHDSIMLMGYYYAQDTYVCDTAVNDGHGRFVFEGKREMLPGLYFFTNPKGRYVEFVNYNEPINFRFHTTESDWRGNMKVKGSRQNELFIAYHNDNEAIYTALRKAKSELDSVAFAAYQEQAFARLDSIKLALINNHPESMAAKMINSTRPVEVPVANQQGDTLDSRARFDYFMAHYFDNIPLDDNMIVRTPKALFYQHVMDYVDHYMKGMPPTLICPLLDTMIDRSEKAPEVYKWLVHTMTEKFLQSNVMVYDEVYVHLVQRYYASGKAFWSSPSVIDEQVERATKWERLLVGKEAPELIMFDTLHRPCSLHHMPGQFTLLVFWSPTCGHCREAIPALYKVFDRIADSLDIYAYTVLTEPDEVTVKKWKKFIADNNINNRRWVNLNGGEANVDWREVYDVTVTPQVFLINNHDHKFMAKKLNAELLDNISKYL